MNIRKLKLKKIFAETLTDSHLFLKLIGGILVLICGIIFIMLGLINFIYSGINEVGIALVSAGSVFIIGVGKWGSISGDPRLKRLLSI